MSDWLDSLDAALEGALEAPARKDLIALLRPLRLVYGTVRLEKSDASPDGDGVRVDATLTHPEEKWRVRLRLCVETKGHRPHCVGLIEHDTDPKEIRAFVGAFFDALDETVSEIFDTVGAADAVVFSTRGRDAAPAWPPGLPDTLFAGVSFTVSELKFPDEFLGGIAAVLQKDLGELGVSWKVPVALVEVAAADRAGWEPPEPGSRQAAGAEADEDSEMSAEPPEDGGPDAAQETPMTLSLGLPVPKGLTQVGNAKVNAEIDRCELRLPIAPAEPRGARLVLPVHVTVDKAQLEAEAAVDLLYGILMFRLKAPTLDQVLHLAGCIDEKEALTGGMNDLSLDDVWLLVALEEGAERGVIAAGFSATGHALLFDGHVDFLAQLQLRIDDPADPDAREWRGLLSGNVEIGTYSNLRGEMELPLGRFRVAEKLSLNDDLMQALKIPLDAVPQQFQGKQVDFVLEGDTHSKSYSASLALNSPDAAAEIGPAKWTLQNARFGVAYAGGETSVLITADLVLAGTLFEVSGGYEDGFFVDGRSVTTIQVAKVADTLLEGYELPTSLQDLELADVRLFADTRSGDYGFSARTKRDWDVSDFLTLRIERFGFEKTAQGNGASLAASFQLDDIWLRVAAEKAATEDGGWTFEGGLPAGEILPLSEIVRKVADQFCKGSQPPLPDMLDDFDIAALDVTYATKDNRLSFNCTGYLSVDRVLVTATVAVVVIQGSEDKAAQIQFEGDVTIRDILLRGHFDKGDTGSWFVGSVSGAQVGNKPLTFRPGETAGEILPEAKSLLPTTELTLDQAILAYDRKRMLFELDIDMDASLNLSQVPAVKALIGEAEIGLHRIGLLATSGAFSKEDIQKLNATLTDPVQIASPGGDADIAEGFAVTGAVSLLDMDLPLMLQLVGKSDADAHKGETNDTPVRAKTAPSETPVGDGAGSSARADTAAETNSDRSGDAASSMTKWFDVGKSLGPLHLGRVGLGYDDGELGLLLDGGVDLAGLHVGLRGFTVKVPIQPEPRPSFGLEGLDLSYSGGPVEISGAFLRSGDDRFDGIAVFKAPKLAISGIGSYTTIEGSTSMFIFAALHAELGGPPFFRVRGLSAGFGYNRTLTLPPIDKVQGFPLVRAALEEDYLQGDNTEQVITTAMDALKTFVAPSKGDYWLAAGIKFSSFEIIHSVALLSVSFGTEVEIGLLGLSRLRVPREAGSAEIAFVELALRASIKPEAGTFQVEGRLTDASYLFTGKCRLTGGFAFFAWFSGAHSGDFVVTLGGYNRNFAVPDHYPVVPRLGVQWQVTSELAITSELYFALTPACIMAGGRLAAVYKSGAIRAWFVAYADFYVQWQPLYYHAEIGVRIGVEADLKLFTVHVEISVDLMLWGPEFGGTAHVDLTVVSFSIPFGAKKVTPGPIDAAAFRTSFLPDPATVVGLQVARGLVRELKRDNEPPLRLVNAHALALVVQSQVPLTEFAVTHADRAFDVVDAGDAARLGIAPMRADSLSAAMTLTLTRNGNPYHDFELFGVTGICDGVPSALWAGSASGEKTKERRAVLPAVTGVTLGFDAPEPVGALGWMTIRANDRDRIPRTLPSPHRKKPVSDEEIEAEALRAALARFGMAPDSAEPLHTMRSIFTDDMRHDTYFQANPETATLGSALEAAP